jgi:hypothetical protein
MILTEEFVRTGIDTYNALSDRIREVANEVAKVRQICMYDPAKSYDGFYFEDGKLYAKFSEYYRGDTYYETIEIPLPYLWIENFVEVEKLRYAAERAEEKRLAALEEERKAQKRQQQAEAKDLKEWERLKQKFGA